MNNRFEYASEATPERAVARIIGARRVHRPINQKWPAHNRVTVHKSPVAAVLTVIAVIAHRKIFARRNNQLISLYVLLNVGPPFVDHIDGIHLPAKRWE